MFRDILKPVYTRLTKPALDRGIPIQMHNCGRCEDFIGDMIDFGVRIWDPAQTSNDLSGIKQKYLGRLSLAGGWDFEVPLTWPQVDEAAIRLSVREAIDCYAPGGGYAFGGAVLTATGDTLGRKINRWIAEEAYRYGRDYYIK
jgi:hypothetical protein